MDVILTSGHPIADCVDLRATFADRYRIEFEESYFAEKPEFRSAEAAWLSIIPCKFGHIYPQGGRLLAAYTGSPSRRRMLKALDCCRVHVDGDWETTVVFDVSGFDQVAKIMQPKRRRRLSPAQRAASIQRLAAYRFRPRSDARQIDSGGLGRDASDQDGQDHVQVAHDGESSMKTGPDVRAVLDDRGDAEHRTQ